MKFNAITKTIMGAICLAAWNASAQKADWPVGWQGCPAPTADDFTVDRIVTRDKDDAQSPIKIDFHEVEDPGAPNGVWTNFYFNELHTGMVRYYDEATNSVTDVGEVVGGSFGGKDTFSGLVLDPGFDKTNRWIYTNYSGDGFFRLARYTITEDNKLDQSSMKVLMDMPKNNGKWHGECAIDFDAYGDLWVGIGDNGSSGNGLKTAEYAASILRIHPEDDGTYSIPSKAAGDPTGNMGEYWSGKFTEMGETDLAAEYADETKVLPEIYAKGVRNPYTVKVVHAANRWVAFGDVGPDHGSDHSEEFHIMQEPGFLGWNVWAGEDELSGKANHDGITPGGSPGASGLPPITDAQYAVHQASAMAGGIYWYDGNLQSDRKFPAYYHGKWFVSDNDQDAWDGPPWVRVLTMNEDYTETVSFEDFFGFTKERIQDLWFGPDGALYIAYFYKPWFGNSGQNEIVRISYNPAGNENCLPAELVPPDGAIPTSIASRSSSSRPGIHFASLGEIQLSDWKGEVRLFDVLGNEVPLRHAGNGVYRLQGTPTAGVYFLKTGAEVYKVSNITSR